MAYDVNSLINQLIPNFPEYNMILQFTKKDKRIYIF